MHLLNFLRDHVAEFISMRMLLAIALGVAAFLFLRGVFATVTWILDPTRRRLGFVDPSFSVSSTMQWAGKVRAAIQPMARYLLPTTQKELGTMQERFVKAGYTSADAMPLFYALKMALAVLFFVGYEIGSHWMPRVSGSQNLLLLVATTFTGLMLPNFILNRKVERRQRNLRNAFPDALDLLIVCVESGLGLAAALHRVSLELKISWPDLASELERVNGEMQAGMDREVALRSLATRTGLSDVRALVGLLVQTLRFGTSVADALRVYSDEFRDKRMQAAEERAATLGTKMIFPMVLCFFPSFFLIAIGPALIKVMQVFGGH